MKPLPFSEHPQLHNIEVSTEIRWPQDKDIPSGAEAFNMIRALLAHRIEAHPSVHSDRIDMDITPSAAPS